MSIRDFLYFGFGIVLMGVMGNVTALMYYDMPINYGICIGNVTSCYGEKLPISYTDFDSSIFLNNTANQYTNFNLSVNWIYINGLNSTHVNIKENLTIEKLDANEILLTDANKQVISDLIEKYLNPVGVMQIYTNMTPPSGWLICNGSAVSRSTYGSLFGIIGTRYGSGDGSTTFNLPDMRGRFPIGMNSSNNMIAILGVKNGSTVHYHTISGGGGLGGVTSPTTSESVLVSYTGTGTTYNVTLNTHVHSWGGGFSFGGATSSQFTFYEPGYAPVTDGKIYPPYQSFVYIIKY